MSFLKAFNLFSRSSGADRDHRLQEVQARVDHGQRIVDNAVEEFHKSSSQFREAKESLVSEEMLGMVRQLSATLDRK